MGSLSVFLFSDTFFGLLARPLLSVFTQKDLLRKERQFWILPLVISCPLLNISSNRRGGGSPMARCSRVTFLALALLTGAAAFVVALFFKFGTFAEWLDQESCIAWHWLRSGSPYSLWFHERFLQPLESERDRLLVV